MAMSRHDVIGEELVLQTKGLFPEPIKFLKEAKDSFEKSYLVNVLSLAKGNVSKASEISGKYRADFYALLKKHDLKPESFKEQ
jgi:two-component system response regulator GlrR